jgi:hypothetical protein
MTTTFMAGGKYTGAKAACSNDRLGASQINGLKAVCTSHTRKMTNV